MSLSPNKTAAARIINELRIALFGSDWAGFDPVAPVFERMADDGATVVVKIDGQRKTDDDNGRYTVLVTGGPLGDDFFRADCAVLEEGLAGAIMHFAERCWKRTSQ